MIALLRGTIVSQVENTVILDVNGVGYQLQLSGAALRKIKGNMEPITFYTHMQIKEDGIDLYGFATQDEKELFQKIIGVSGTGCKTALNILLSMTKDQFITAISLGDREALTKVSGVGKKTAERLILELKDVLAKNITNKEQDSIWDTIPEPELGITQDALSALSALGFGFDEAQVMLQKALAEIGETSDLQLLLKTALSAVGKGRK